MAARRFWPEGKDDDPNDPNTIRKLGDVLPNRQFKQQGRPPEVETDSQTWRAWPPSKPTPPRTAPPERAIEPDFPPGMEESGPEEYSHGGAVRKGGSSTCVVCKDKFAR